MDTELKEMWIRQYFMEMDNEMLYVMMSTVAMKMELDRFCKLFKEQAAEEHDHAMKIYKYLLERRIPIKRTRVSEEFKLESKSMRSFIELSYRREMLNTKNFREIYDEVDLF